MELCGKQLPICPFFAKDIRVELTCGAAGFIIILNWRHRNGSCATTRRRRRIVARILEHRLGSCGSRCSCRRAQQTS